MWLPCMRSLLGSRVIHIVVYMMRTRYASFSTYMLVDCISVHSSNDNMSLLSDWREVFGQK